MAAIAFLCGLPLFFEVGFVLLVPIAFTVARQVGVSILMTGLPMVAGLSVVHGLVPPTPPPCWRWANLRAGGRTVLYAILVGVPTAAIAGPLFTRLVAPRIQLPAHNPIGEQLLRSEGSSASLPSFGITLGTILLPVALMLLGGWADALSTRGSGLNQVLSFIGNSVVALLIATLFSFWSLGLARGFTVTRS